MNRKSLNRVVSVVIMVALFTTMLLGCVSQTTTTAGTTKATTTAGTTTAATGTGTTPAGTTQAGKVDEVKIGFLWPLTGGSATIGQQHFDGAQMAIEEINANGGIKSLGGAKIVPIVADTETKPDVGSTQTERLILKENVCMVVGAYNSAVCFPASEVAQRYKTPWLNMGGVKNEITTRGYEWVFRPNNMSDYDIREMIDGIKLLAKEANQEVKTYAVVYESTDWGSDAAKVFKAEADKLGWKLVLDEPVTTGQADMNAQVLKVKKANPDVLNTSFYTPEMIVFSKALAANKVNPKFGHWTVGGGAQDPAYFKAVDKSVYEYMFVQEDWDVGGPERYPWIKEIAAKVAATKDYKINSFFSQGWTAAYLAYSAIEAAGSIDKEEIRKGLLSLDINREDQKRQLMTGYLRMKFVTEGNVTNQNIYSGGTIIQYQKGVPVALAPAENRLPGAKAVFPIPDDWDTRGK